MIQNGSTKQSPTTASRTQTDGTSEQASVSHWRKITNKLTEGGGRHSLINPSLRTHKHWADWETQRLLWAESKTCHQVHLCMSCLCCSRPHRTVFSLRGSQDVRSYENQLRENEIAHTKGAIQCKYTEELLQIQWLEHTGLDQDANYGRVWGSDLN